MSTLFLLAGSCQRPATLKFGEGAPRQPWEEYFPSTVPRNGSFPQATQELVELVELVTDLRVHTFPARWILPAAHNIEIRGGGPSSTMGRIFSVYGTQEWLVSPRKARARGAFDRYAGQASGAANRSGPGGPGWGRPTDAGRAGLRGHEGRAGLAALGLHRR